MASFQVLRNSAARVQPGMAHIFPSMYGHDIRTYSTPLIPA